MKTTGPAATKVASATATMKQTGCRVLSRTPLVYDAGADAKSDRPAHVRSGSGCCFVDIPGQGRRLAVVQDDAAFVALVDVKGGKAGTVGSVGFVELPAGPGGLRQFEVARGNKADKLDLEAVASVVVDGRPGLFAMGSGSTARREVFVLVTFGSDGQPRVEELAAGAFFKGLQQNHDFAGDEINVEGMDIDGDKVRFWNRGNGAGDAIDAVGEVSFAALLRHLRDPLAVAPPKIGAVKSFDLGAIDGTRLTFTDATRHGDRTLFIAAAEASPNTYDDGVVKGVALGFLGADGSVTVTPILDEQGRHLSVKVEGIAVDPGNPKQAWIVVDKDDATAPAELLLVQLP